MFHWQTFQFTKRKKEIWFSKLNDNNIQCRTIWKYFGMYNNGVLPPGKRRQTLIECQTCARASHVIFLIPNCLHDTTTQLSDRHLLVFPFKSTHLIVFLISVNGNYTISCAQNLESSLMSLHLTSNPSINTFALLLNISGIRLFFNISCPSPSYLDYCNSLIAISYFCSCPCLFIAPGVMLLKLKTDHVMSLPLAQSTSNHLQSSYKIFVFPQTSSAHSGSATLASLLFLKVTPQGLCT